MGRNVNVNAGVLLDSGTTISYFTPSIARSIIYALGGQVHFDSAGNKAYVADCKTSGTVDFQFDKTSRSPFLLRNSFTNCITLMVNLIQNVKFVFVKVKIIFLVTTS